jgi:type VI secretion system protein ImpE
VATDDARQLLDKGDPANALARAQADVRADPANPKLRAMLFQILCLTGQWERAMNQLKVLTDLDPVGSPVMVRVGAAAIHCELFRADVFKGERDATIFGEPAEWVGWLVHANKLLATGQTAAADDLRAKALAAAPVIGGTINGEPFRWIADADGRLGPMLEAVVEGKYFWVPMHQVREVAIEPPTEYRDLVWTPAKFTWVNGGEAVGLIPTRYPGSADVADPAICMAAKTDWVEHGAIACGRGQRLFATDQADYPILETRTIRLDLPPAAVAAEGTAS